MCEVGLGISFMVCACTIGTVKTLFLLQNKQKYIYFRIKFQLFLSVKTVGTKAMLHPIKRPIQNSTVHISQSDSIQLRHNYSDYSVIKAGISPEISTQNTVHA